MLCLKTTLETRDISNSGFAISLSTHLNAIAFPIATMANGNSDENEDESLFVQSAEAPPGDFADAAMDELLLREQDAPAPPAPEDSGLTPIERARILNQQSQQQQVDTYRFFKTHPVTLSTVLPFQKEIVIKMLAKDSLLILGRGLGMVKIASNLIHAIDVAGNSLNDLDMSKPKDLRPNSKAEQSLVIVLGALDRELDTIKEDLRELAIIDGISTIFPEDEDLVTDDESTSQTEQKPAKNHHRGVTILKTDSRYTVEKRASLYAKGGVYIVTSRIFIVDLLSNVIDSSKITGIVVMHADRITHHSTESFILRVFRQKNKLGFIKALSDVPENFSGFSPLATVMRNLRVSQAFLWPRFHVEVDDSLNLKHLMYKSSRTGQLKRPQTADISSVIEIEVELTESMKQIQTTIMACIEECLGRIKKLYSQIDIDFWNLDSAMSQNFDYIVRKQMDPIWHRLSSKTKRDVFDLTTLRQLLVNMPSYDPITFYKAIDTIFFQGIPQPGTLRDPDSRMLFSDSFETLLEVSRRRVFGSRSKSNTSDKTKHSIEELPKWDQLAKILEEIGVEKSKQTAMDGPILILCKDRKTCRQLSWFLRTMTTVESSGFKFYSGEKYLNTLLNDFRDWRKSLVVVRRQLDANRRENNNTGNQSGNYKSTTNNNSSIRGANNNSNNNDASRGGRPLNKRRRVRGDSAVAVNSQVSSRVPINTVDNVNAADPDLEIMEATSDDGTKTEEVEEDEGFEVVNVQDSVQILDSNELILIHTYDKQNQEESLLQEISPSFIIMYEPDTTFIRRAEIYRSSNPYKQVRVYFMYYGMSVEEQRYLAAVRKEKDAFTRLVREKASLPITIVNDLDTEDPEAVYNRISKAGTAGNNNTKTRIAGGQIINRLPREPMRILVDHREFMSSLPNMIHLKHISVIPLQLTVGDYILSPKICVERKSIPDLVASFNSGRLYTQCQAMFRYYEQPVLLIEFDEAKSFSFETFSDLPGGGGGALANNTISSAERSKLIRGDIQAKLVILLLHYPKLNIIWSSSPEQTSEIFYNLKISHGSQEPNIDISMSYGLKDDLIAESDRDYNHTAIDLLKSIPGVTEANFRTLINTYRSLQDLVKADTKELEELLGHASGKKVYEFINKSFN